MYIVYKALNLITNKVYIGISSRNLEKRIYYHYEFANSKRVTKTHHFALALKKYTKESWHWNIIDTCPSSATAYSLERKYISDYNSYSNGYNSTLGGEGSHGRKLSEITKNKIGTAHKGKKLTKEHKDKCSKALKGRKLTEQDKHKKAIAAKNRPCKAKSGHKGITFTRSGKWNTVYTVNRNNVIYLGTFATLNEAIKARDDKEKELA